MTELAERDDILIMSIVEAVSKIENIVLYMDRPHDYQTGDGLTWEGDKSSIMIALDLTKATSTPRSSRIANALSVAFSIETIEAAVDQKSLTLTLIIPKATEAMLALRDRLRNEVRNKSRALLASAEQYVKNFFLPHLSPLEAKDIATELLGEITLGTHVERKPQCRSPS